ncbi:L-2-hydroxyisocaproate dehydrogenase [Listeria grayi]|uniref:L-lactate dehydrogenase n=1 Tax=Listeria grayi FSL F6-1183 TaxID=1265827 RepID=A0A829RAQ5_LISGR|nr:L-lactate dehydrogenase [Listeria grayi]EUJ30137.1 lactate/malate dehydrogenase [Listeria grayi FSL F6-1183]VEI33704.1 L-2-hydroxyisocaproate dehydrogenase [Listeria grayi]
MRKLGIIGVGHVGAEVAFSVVTQGICDEIVLIDKNQEKAESEAIELRDMASLTAFHTTIHTQDYHELRTADVIVIAVGQSDLLHEDRMEELKATSKIIKEIVPKIVASGFKGIIINITNPCDVITMMIQAESDFPKDRVFGTGTSLDTARMKRVVGEALAINPKSVDGYVLGEHGESQFIAWSTVNVAGTAIQSLPEAKDFDLPALKDSVRGGGWKILLGKGWTNFGIATIAAKLTAAVFNDARQVFPLSVYDEALDVYIGKPALLGKEGIIHSVAMHLKESETAALEASAQVISAAYQTVK